MKRNIIISNTLVVIFLGLFIYYFFNHTSDFKALLDLNPLLLIVVAFGYIGSFYMSGLFNKLVIKPFNKHISHLEAFRVALISSIGNYFGPLLGGTGMRAVYLKKKVGLKYTDFISTLYGFYIVSFLISAVLGLISLGLLHSQYQARGYIILITFFTGVAISMVFIIQNKNNAFIDKAIQAILKKRFNTFGNLTKSWGKITKQPGLILSLAKITALNIGIFLVVNYCEFLITGVKLHIGSLLLYTCLGVFSILISLTPGALGIREAIYLFSASVMGVTNSQILKVALIDRSMQFIVMTSGWLVISVANKWATKRDNKNQLSTN